jgi:DNA-binding NtrC family response regulator
MSERSADVSKEELNRPRANVLVVDDEPTNLQVLYKVLGEREYDVSVASSGAEALEIVDQACPDLVLLDLMMPGIDGLEVCRRLRAAEATRNLPVIILTASGEDRHVLDASAMGANDYVVKPFRTDEVCARVETQLQVSRLVRALKEKSDELTRQNAALKAEMARGQQLSERLHLWALREDQRWGLAGFIGQSPTVRKILDDIELLQQAHSTSVLITGESGTGKELIARAIHATSKRGDESFVAVSCAAIPADLAESLFFGHQKGSFTGAERDQSGYFDLAAGGTLFLDEVGEMPLDLQSKLLRVLEERRIWPLGAVEGHAVDVRILAATNVDLQQAIAVGAFRRDLYYRLARFVVEVPPLRQRRDDVELLARHFLALFAEEMGIAVPELAPEALLVLQGHTYPGNVRELKNVIERALLESRGAEIQPHHLHLESTALPQAEGETSSAADAFVASLPLNFAEAEVALIQRALRETRGNMTEAAQLLGINRTKLYRKLPKKPSQD